MYVLCMHVCVCVYVCSVCYSADGSCVLAGGNSKYVCIYHIQRKILLKKFQVWLVFCAYQFINNNNNNHFYYLLFIIDTVVIYMYTDESQPLSRWHVKQAEQQAD